MADVFSDHMVLQQDMTVPIWGTAAPGQGVRVTFGDQTLTTQSDHQGRWRVEFPSLKANATPTALTIQADTRIVLHDVLVGEVWYASGQSNMGYAMKACARRLDAVQALIDSAYHPSIRYRAIKVDDSPSPQGTISDGAAWTVCSPQNATDYSAVAYLYAKRLHEELGVPIGIIESAWGGHPIEPFIPAEAFVGRPVLEKELELGRLGDTEGLARMVGGVRARKPSWLPGRIFNSRVAPVTDFAIRGAIWYQGESNCGRGEDPRHYTEKMTALVRGWRVAWGRPELPIYYVQLPQFASPGWVTMRDQQRRALTESHTGMAVTIDLAQDNIHPANKIDVAERLALWPLAQVYGRDVQPSGPMFKGIRIDGHNVIVSFDHAAQGLAVGQKTDLHPTRLLDTRWVSGFELVDGSGQWRPAVAVIRGDTVVCTNDHIATPIGVRYAWAPAMPGDRPWNLYNGAGLPASPFVSDPALDSYVPEPVKP
ncbi:MAG: sialate O-acetylesterase [Planctomycetota bacterium]